MFHCSLEPTEVTSSSFSASPRPKMLYNGSQSYNPDQYDPIYAVYDEDGELYKDSGKFVHNIYIHFILVYKLTLYLFTDNEISLFRYLSGVKFITSMDRK